MIRQLIQKREGVGLDLGSETIKLVHLRKERGECTLVTWGKAPVPPGAVDRGLIKNKGAVASAIKGLFEANGIPNRKVITALSVSCCFVKHLVLPPLNKREAKRAARLQVAAYLPWESDDAVMDVAVYQGFKDGQGVEVLVAAARKTTVLEIERTLQEAGLVPVAAEIVPLACYRLLGNKYKKMGILLVDLGASGIQFAYFAWGRLKMVRSVGLRQVDYSSPNVSEDVIREVLKTVEYAYVQQVTVEPNRIVIVGGGAESEKVRNHLKSLLPHWEVADISELIGVEEIPHSVKLLGPSYAAALGMAWRGIAT